MVGEMSVRGNVLLRKCRDGEVFFGEVYGREIVRSGKCPPGKCPVGKLSYNHPWWSFFAKIIALTNFLENISRRWSPRRSVFIILILKIFIKFS